MFCNLKIESSELPDHGLVFIWQSLADNVTQPIAVFTSKRLVKGVDLAQLVLRSILLLEDAELQVPGLTCEL
ncbi:Dimer Tnp hAT domain-containing protein [Aphis craccivora]|uniref:Dimer Tnp hAT domain-containing protein n=1 Tax=Aphis craccivora TaxID=307492 RepID=A0A6G0YIF4_APHCR|nr:Dimer Tnp hAT domain-containing protein [Aphis craccivora]